MKVSNPKAPARYPSVPVSRLVGHDGPIQAICFTADGKYCVTGAVDRTVRLWNPCRLDPAFPPRPYDATVVDVPVEALPHALPIQTYQDGLTHAVSAVAVNDTTLISASERTVVVLDLLTKQAKRRLGGHTSRVNAVSITPNSETYLSASYDATVRIWDGRSRSYEPIQILKEAKDSVTGVHAVQSDHQALIRACSVDGILRTYDIRRGLLHCDDMTSPITSMVPSHDGQYLSASCLDGIIRLVEADSGQLVNSYEKHHVAGQYGLGCCFTADDGSVVSGSEDGSCVVYDLVQGTCVQRLLGHDRPTCAVATHPKQSSALISASFDGHAVVWANTPDFMSWQDAT